MNHVEDMKTRLGLSETRDEPSIEPQLRTSGRQPLRHGFGSMMLRGEAYGWDGQKSLWRNGFAERLDRILDRTTQFSAFRDDALNANVGIVQARNICAMIASIVVHTEGLERENEALRVEIARLMSEAE